VVDRVFEPFFTTKPATERGGSGLGLAVAYGIVRQHEGLMHCYSELGVGTTFKVYLPVLERSATDVGTKIEGAVPGGDERILVAEDDPSLRDTIRRALEGNGYDVSIVPDGEAACRAASIARYDVVLLDVSMPQLSGVAALERICRTLPAARFILSSGHGGDGVSGNLAASNVRYQWLPKPYATDTLLRFVRQTLDRP
jgi:CheY-like chemotaxis protein